MESTRVIGTSAVQGAGLMPMERQLSTVLTDFARTMATEFSVQEILDHLVRRMVEILPVTAVGVTIMSDGADRHHRSSSSAAAARYEALQGDLGEGPGLLSFRSGESVAVPDLRSDSRFRTFADLAEHDGLAAVFAFPLHHVDSALGALNLYRNAPGELPEDASVAARTLADVAAAYLINAQVREDLQQAWRRSRLELLHDGLTGLPNREHLMAELTQALGRSPRSGLLVAVLVLDLDRLKFVNDTYGHRVGDELLVAVGKRLAGMIRPGDTLGRLGGDEFVVVAEGLENSNQAAALGRRLLAAIGRRFGLGEIELDVTASIGLACADPGEYTPEHLLHAADVAMYQAKRAGGDRQQIFQDRLHHLLPPAHDLDWDLTCAIERRELRNEYQPIVHTADGRITGFEALLRWSHPTRGEVPPATVIPLAERSEMINDIGRWALGQAWADRSSWRAGGTKSQFAVAVNVSARQIMSEGFADVVAGVLSAGEGSADLLTLEITESVFLRDSEYALSALAGLRSLGVKLALDDFGTGYSSLNYFKRFAVDIIKIDQSFVVDLARNRASRAIVGAVVRLAHDLGMTVVAEGVENAEQYDAVAGLGCDSSQGFYFGKPMSSTTIDKMVTHRAGDRPDLSSRSIHIPALPRPRVPHSDSEHSIGLGSE